MSTIASEVAGVASPVSLRPLTGWDELAVTSGEPRMAFAMLQRLAADVDGRPLALEGWKVSDVDRLLAAVYDRLYGDRVVCRSTCGACDAGYEFDLSIADLLASQDAERPGPPDADGAWSVGGGMRVRAPLFADLAAARRPGELLSRLVVGEAAEVDADEVARFLERAAPVLGLDLDARCPECGSAEQVRFDLSRYLAERVLGERPFLLREAHLIAACYGWSHDEIMSLPRDDRRAYAGLIGSERTAAARKAVL